MSTILWPFGIWSNLERWKSSVSGCLMSWPQIVVLKCHLFLFYTTVIHFSIRLQCVTKSGFYMATSSVVGLRRSSKALPKAKPAPKIGHGHCLVVCCWSDPLQLSESWWNLYICEVCSANQWDTVKTAIPAASIDQEKGPNSFPQQHTTTLQKLNKLNYEVLPHLPYSPDLSPTTTSSSILTTFCRQNLQPAGCRKCFSRIPQILKH